jgi:hypothetical protein
VVFKELGNFQLRGVDLGYCISKSCVNKFSTSKFSLVNFVFCKFCFGKKVVVIKNVLIIMD